MCLGLAKGYIEPEKRSGSVSLIDGHIDPDTSEMTPQEALSIVEGYEKALKEDQEFLNNGDEFHIEALKVCDVVKQALEKQIAKKPKGYKCPNCDNDSLGNGEYIFNCCEACGQALDLSDTE